MSQNNAIESSLSLNGLNVVVEDESDYVFVDDCGLLLNAEDFDDDDDDDDDDSSFASYDHCDLSPSLSCATSVATNVTLKDLNLIEDSAMMDVDEDAPTTTEAMDTEEVRSDGNEGQSYHRSMVASKGSGAGSALNALAAATNRSWKMSSTTTAAMMSANPKNGRRLSNKKLRKKMKMLKKAAAAKAAEESLALANQKAAAAAATLSSSESTEASDTVMAAASRSPKRNKSSSNSNNVAVACAQETLAAYREEVEAGKIRMKKTRAVSIDVP